MDLAYSQNDLSLSYVGLHYSRPSANRIAYRLVGYEEQWHEASAKGIARYTNLLPGDYVFEVKAANPYGVWSRPTVLRITIAPPWWQTTWAYVFYIVGLGLLIFAGFEWRMHQLTAQARRLSTEVEARTRELRMEKEKTEEQARRLADLDQAKNHFFANISHEFRTPLTLLLGPIQDLIDTEPDPSRRQRHRIMQRSARRLQGLIDQLLDLSRLEAGHLTLDPQAGDLAAFLARLTRSYTPLAERRELRLTCSCEPRVLLCRFDRDACEKIIGNLLSNALKFTPAGGTVAVMLRKGEGAMVDLAVSDTGPGIGSEDLTCIFDRFYQGDTSSTRAHEGSGIGLALARELTELHGGMLEVESAIGTGSTFIVRLPLEECVGMEAPAPVLSNTRPGTRKSDLEWLDRTTADVAASEHTLLIVEDNPDVRGLSTQSSRNSL